MHKYEALPSQALDCLPDPDPACLFQSVMMAQELGQARITAEVARRIK